MVESAADAVARARTSEGRRSSRCRVVTGPTGRVICGGNVMQGDIVFGFGGTERGLPTENEQTERATALLYCIFGPHIFVYL